MSPTLQYPAFVPSDLRILVLDNIALHRNKLVDALKTMGATLITQAVDWTTGLKLLKSTKHKFDIVLCDMELDCADSIEFLHHAAAKKVGGCILTDSGKADPNLSAKSVTFDCGLPVLGVLPEPLEFETLRKLLRDYCEISTGPDTKAEGYPQRQWTRNELYSALCRNQFVPFFQPKVDLATARTTSVEMLARWNHPDLGILPPSEFIELMEQHALIDQLTDTLLQQSLIRIRQWNVKGWNVGLAVNFSPLTLQDPGISSRVASLLANYDVQPGQITVEVTETAAAQDFNPVLDSLTQLERISPGFTGRAAPGTG
jgi:CheY-like chemotaxis protein